MQTSYRDLGSRSNGVRGEDGLKTKVTHNIVKICDVSLIYLKNGLGKLFSVILNGDLDSKCTILRGEKTW